MASAVNVSEGDKSPVKISRLSKRFIRWRVGFLIDTARNRWYIVKLLRSYVGGWVWVVLWGLGLKIPFEVEVAGERKKVKDESDYEKLLHQLLHLQLKMKLSKFQQELSPEEGKENGLSFVKFNFAGRRPTIYFRDEDSTALEIMDTFLNTGYHRLNVQGRDVLNVGAWIADTAIFFALQGANKVVALEPYPSTYDTAKLNITVNGLEDKVTLLNEGTGSPGWVNVDSKLYGNTRPLEEIGDNRTSSQGVSIRVSSLSQLVERFGLDDAVLEMNCQGCEYDVLQNASNATIRRFSQLMFEYHYGASNALAKRLEGAGFSVQMLGRKFGYSRGMSDPHVEMGQIFAKRS